MQRSPRNAFDHPGDEVFSQAQARTPFLLGVASVAILKEISPETDRAEAAIRGLHMNRRTAVSGN
jgi:hypothetical protein